MEDAKGKFKELLNTTEVRKVDFKQSQYRLDDTMSKSRFIMDMLCMANASGGDGNILLGVQEKPRAIVGISHHHDSSDLEQIVNSIVTEPIQFEYYPVQIEGKSCALLHIPQSRARPHRPKKDYGIIKKHIFYTRRASGNREASIAEIREMMMSSIPMSDMAQHKAKTSQHITDELADLNVDERKSAMYAMLKSIAPKLGLTKYYAISHSRHTTDQIVALVANKTATAVYDYAIFMYPWIAKLDDLKFSYWRIGYLAGESNKEVDSRIKTRLIKNRLIHIAYKTIYSKALETRPFLVSGDFANAWDEPWGRVIKWSHPTRNERYDFFLSNVSSKAELKDRLEQLLIWVDNNIK